MKVDVLHVDEATFPSRLSWWTKWIDIAVFDYGGAGYLLQMKVSRMNGKSFRSKRLAGTFSLVEVHSSTAGNLTQMKATT